MLVMGILFFIILMLSGVISVAIKLAWGATKFLFGLGLFLFCPVLFIIAVLLGGFTYLWLPILIVGALFGRGFCRI